MSNVFVGNGERSQVDWNAVHGDNNREFEPHHDFFIAHLEKTLLKGIFPACD